MRQPIHVLGFAGSLRRGSYNRALLQAADALLPDGMTLETFDLSPIPLYNDDVRASGFPTAVQEFRERIKAADALLIATPEYNYSVSGVLKNALDWASRPDANKHVPLKNKPTAIMGASSGMFGTVRAQMHLRQIFVYTDTPLVSQPQVLLANAKDKFDANLHLIDEDSRGFLRGLLERLAALVTAQQAETASAAR
ncbi:MAG: NAD(P)H-dependent oxidoreductase [Anaerolinea sp.]|nr:NAD(P)H-dependent oxidoreductase [Anaerolinea sp.]